MVKEVILYSSINCPRCDEVKELLNGLGVKYIVNQNKEEMKQLGLTHVPVIKFNDEMYEYNEILNNLEKFQEIDARKLMSDTKFYEAYARYDESKKRYETWNKSVDRVMNMHKTFYKDKLKNNKELQELIEEASVAYKDKLFLGSQRALQFGGEQLLKAHAKLYNCAASHCDRPNFFGGYFYLLLAGCGVGFSVQKQHISKLPNITKRNKSAKTYVVPDSIEGWASTIDVLLSSYFDNNQVYPEYAGRKVYFDLSNIRPKGSLISGGFKAPGAEPLRKALDTIELLIENELKKDEDRLKPIVAYDIGMHIADAVISGGIRRAATICMFSKDDNEMINAKTGNWFVENPQRGRSNNSVVLLRDKTSIEEFQKIMESVKDYGEPAFIWTDSEEFTYNPCFTGKTSLLTKNGYRTFEELCDREIDIINKDGNISHGKVWCSGEKEIIRLEFDDDNFIECTPNHVFKLFNESTYTIEEIEAKDTLNHILCGYENNKRVISIQNIGIHKVYDFSEPLTNWGVVNDVIAHNCVEVGMLPKTVNGVSGFQVCNLVEINGSKSTTKEIFFQQCKVASILGTLQAGYTDFKFFKDATKEIVEKEALIGVGITGMMNNPQVIFNEEVMREGANIVKYWNKKVSKMIDINQSARCTVIKPSGNSSVLLECASGIHGEHSPSYLRHVQLSKDTEVAKLLQKTNPHMCQDSVWNRERDIVVAFPITPIETSIFKKDLLGVKQLEYVKKTQQVWIEEGTNVDLCTDPRLRHNVSNTITVDNWDDVTKYIYENRNYLCGVSLLSSFGDKAYPQAPFTEILDYEDIVKKYGIIALFTSALIEASLNAFNHDLWTACNTALGYGEKLTEERCDLLKRDFVRRFNKFATNFKSKDDCANCLKDVYNLHKMWKIQKSIKNINWIKELGRKEYVDIDTLGATTCAGGKCEI
jgi:glutaredoxin